MPSGSKNGLVEVWFTGSNKTQMTTIPLLRRFCFTHLLVGWFVCRNMQKLQNGFHLNLVEGWATEQIQEFLITFCNTVRKGSVFIFLFISQQIIYECLRMFMHV